jgi:hypothetical protein
MTWLEICGFEQRILEGVGQIPQIYQRNTPSGLQLYMIVGEPLRKWARLGRLELASNTP